MHNIRIGMRGEDAAATFLTSKGLTILNRNFKARYVELDIVALEGRTLVFVEVKTRTGTHFGLPIDSISKKKIHALIKSAQYYSFIHPHISSSLRIDVVSVQLSNYEEVLKIEWFKNITSDLQVKHSF